MTVEQVKVIGEMNDSEVQNYIDYLEKDGKVLKSLTLTVDGEFVDMEYAYEPASFERIRRITGYLVGTLDRFNNGKRAEEHDRVKHV